MQFAYDLRELDFRSISVHGRRVAMRFLPLILGVSALLAPELAHATTIFDSVNVGAGIFNGGLETSNTSWDWVDPTANGPNASQFSVSYAQTLSSVSLELSADTPQDGGSLIVVLMRDNGGAPPFTTIPDSLTSSKELATFTNYTVLGTIQDSSLSKTSSLVTLNTNVSLSAGSYWIGTQTSLLPTAGNTNATTGNYGSGQWWWTQPGASVPLTNNFNSIGSVAPFAVGGTKNPGAYELIIDTPEPATIAILGGALAGMGYVRRKNAKRS